MTDTFTPSLRTIALVGDPRSSASVELLNDGIGELPVATAMQADPTDTVGTAAQGHGSFGLVMPTDTPQNDAPTTANLQGDTVSYTEQLGQRLLDAGSNATIADVDSANFNGGSLRIQITAGLQAGADFIFFVGNGRVSLSSQSAGATVFVQLAGDASPVAIGILANNNLFQNDTVINFNSDSATPARVQELLRSITYNGNSDTLISGQRTITYTLNDGDGGISTTTSFVDVTAVNDVPVVNAGTGQASFSEGVNVASTPVAVAPVLSLTDPDNTTFASATATISANREASDLLAFINTNSTTFGNISASYDGATGVLTLTSAGATATRAQFQAALRAVTFTSTSEEPSTATRTVSFVVNDGTDNSVASTRQVLVQANNDAPSGTSQTLIINEDQVRTLSESDFGFTDVDGDAFAGVRFSAAPTGGTLFFDADGAGAGAPVAVTTFPTGTYTAAQLAAGQLTFVPAANLNGAAAASISFSVVDDGGTVGAGQNTDPSPNTLTFDITPQADAPVSANSSATFDEDTAYVFTLADFPFSDADGDNFYSLMVDSHPAAGGLFFDPGGPNGTNRTDLRDFGTNFQVFASDIAAGKLFYIPAANGNGANYASFLFRVRSDNQPAGPFDSAQQSFTFNVTAVNDAPVNGVPGAQAVDEGQALVLSTANGNALSVSDVDATELTVTLSVANGTLTLGDTTGLSFSAGDGDSDTTMTFSGTAAAINAALGTGGLTYLPNAGFAGPDAIAFTASDNGQSGTGPVGTDSDSIAVTVNDVNAAPVLDLNAAAAGTGTAVTVAEDIGGLVAPDAVVTDSDSASFDGGTLTVGYSSGGTASDVVSVQDQSGRFAMNNRIGVGFNNGSFEFYYNTVLIGTAPAPTAGNPLVVTFNANATPAAAQALVRAVTTFNLSDSPPTGARPLTFALTDGDGGSTSAIADVTTTPVNDAPTVVNLDNFTVTQTEGTSNGSGAIAPGAIVTDDSADFDGGSLTVAMTSPYNGRDSISILGNGIVDVNAQREVTVNGVVIGTVSGGAFDNNGTLTIALNGNATPARVQELVRAIFVLEQYGELTGGTRTFDVTLTDGDGGTSPVYTGSLVVTAVNDEPAGTDKTITINEDAAYALTIADFGFSSATAPFNLPEGDALAAVFITTLPTGGTLYLDPDGAGTGALGTAVTTNQRITVADISAGRLVYVPAANASGAGAASFTFQVQDDNATNGTGPGSQDTDQSPNTLTFNVTAVNDAPISTGFDNITYTEGDGVRNLDVGFNQVLTDPDSANFDGGTLTVSITGNKVATEDQLTFTTGGTSYLSASGGVLSYHGVAIATYTAGGVGLDRVFTFNANATLEAVQTVMRNIAYINTNQANPSTDQRTVSYTLTDGDGGTLNLTSTIDVVGVNDAPVVDLNGADPGADNSANYTEQAPVVTLAGDIVLSDVDSATLTGATVRVTGGFVPLAGDGADYLGVNGFGAGAINGITYSYSASTGILTLSGAATVAAYQAVLAQVTFQSTTNNPGTSRTISWTVTDGAATSAAATTTIAVTPVNDPVSSTLPGGTQSGTEDSDLIFSTATGNAIRVADPDQEPITVTLSVANGVLTLSGIAGLSFTTGTGSGDATMTFTGTPAAINAALNGLRYRGDLNFSGADTLTLDVTDGLTNSSGSIAISLAPDDVIDGDSGNNSLDGTTQNDFFDLSQGGDDNLRGYEGDDGFYFGGAYDVNDVIDGGAGARDQIGLQGNYSAGVTLGSLIDVEFVVLLAGNDARFGGQTGTDLNYNIVADSNTIVSDNKLIVQANQLRAGESLTFDGSASAIDFIVYGGFGTDILTGGSGNDGFFFGQGRFGAGDVVNGGAGTMDQLGLQGNFSLAFGAGQLSGIELIALLSAGDNRFGASGGTVSYDLTMHDNNVAAGQTMAISANTLQIGEDLSFDGSAETDGRFEIYSGAGNDVIFGGAGDDLIFGGGGSDTLYGGAGNDIFAYRSVADSSSNERDGIQDFFLGDRIDLSRIDANTSLGGNQDFSFVGTAAFTGTAGELRYQNISSGGPIYLVQGDVDGDGVSDLEIVLVMTDRNELTVGDFIGVNAAAQGAVPLLTEVKTDAAGLGLRADDAAAPDLAFIGPDHDLALSHMTGDLLL